MIKKILNNLCLSLFICGSLFISAFAQNGGTQQNLTGRDGAFAITNARIVTVSGDTIENGTIIIRNGKIEAVGANIRAGGGVETIDGKGLTVYPGMIDAATNMGLIEIGGGAAGTVDVAETGNMNSNAKAITGINPNTSHINVTRVNGTTTVLSLPVSGLVSGQSAIINLNGATQSEMAVVPVFGLIVNFPRVTTFEFAPGVGRRAIEYSQAVKQRDKNVEDLKKIFDEAALYAKTREAYAADKSLPHKDIDLKMEAMIPYLKGEKPVIFTADRERDIRGALKFADELKLKAIILGGAEAWKAADDLKKYNVPVIYTNMWSMPLGQDADYDSMYAGPGKMKAAGVKFAIASGDDGANARDLPYQAGMSAAYGLSKEDALKAVTIYPAEILGISDKMGSIETGKVANIVVTDGDLLDARTNIKYLFINGRLLPLTSRHTELYEAFKNRK
ncbi:MAG: amidohydrolase family protein [Pyrinomonadaceae bacterium]|nr:amidohydrolase family protein [Pyrinomonadaceae bacterium]